MMVPRLRQPRARFEDDGYAVPARLISTGNVVTGIS